MPAGRRTFARWEAKVCRRAGTPVRADALRKLPDVGIAVLGGCGTAAWQKPLCRSYTYYI